MAKQFQDRCFTAVAILALVFLFAILFGNRLPRLVQLPLGAIAMHGLIGFVIFSALDRAETSRPYRYAYGMATVVNALITLSVVLIDHWYGGSEFRLLGTPRKDFHWTY